MVNEKLQVALFWFRRDLRIEDNCGLFHALKSGLPVLPVFVFDKNILIKLEDRDDRRVSFIHRALEDIQQELTSEGSGLTAIYGTPEEAFTQLTNQYEVKAVYTNHDYEPYAIQRDEAMGKWFANRGIAFYTFKDQVIFEKDEILSGSGKPYTVYTPYSRKWLDTFTPELLEPYQSHELKSAFLKYNPPAIPALREMGFIEQKGNFPSKTVRTELLEKYGELRNFPALPATSRLSVHLRFGTISIRHLHFMGQKLSQSWWNELIWREFYMQIIWHFPHVVTQSFKPAYDSIEWRNNEDEFKAWCEGKTGYPIVDAGMRELNATGFMHNRVRMITASFLVKHLLIDWRWGEAYFARKLLDFDLSANNGGWQWASGSGCDAAPYFRVFNPELQMEKFDKQKTYIKKWVPEFGTSQYTKPIVNHEFARKRVLEAYKTALT
jgi:deoxyribodipyrimidine photo-lyase